MVRPLGPVRSGLLFGLTALAWGANYLFVRVGLEYASPLWLAALRTTLGAAGIAVYSAAATQGPGLDRRGRRDALLLGVPNSALFFGLWFAAARTVPAGETAVIIYTFPLWVALFSTVLIAGHLAWGHWLSVAAGFAGVVLVSQPWSTGFRLPLVAVVELLLASISWAVATVLFQRRFRPEELSRANGYQLIGGASVLLALAIAFSGAQLPRSNLDLWIAVAWMGLFGTAFAYAVWFFLLGRNPASRLSGYTFIVPLVALGLSVGFTGESVVPVQALGIGLVLVSIYGVTRRFGNRLSAAGGTADSGP